MDDTNYCPICGGEIKGEPLRPSAVLVMRGDGFYGPVWTCSNCGKVFVFDDDASEAETPEDLGMNYCPHCGAKMVGFFVEDDE